MRPKVCLPPSTTSLAPFVDAAVFGAVEVHFADWVARESGIDDDLTMLACALAVWAGANGHSCVDLDAAREVVRRRVAGREVDETDVAAIDGLPWPTTTQWDEWLSTVSGAIVSRPEAFDRRAPLVAEGRRLFLQRHWDDESTIATDLSARSVPLTTTSSPTTIALLDRLLPATGADGRPNRQREAADVVLTRRLAVVVGGPGTGKTYSVARILAVLLTENPSLQVALAAPTGKAAARVGESLVAALGNDEVSEHVAQGVRDRLALLRPSTLHRLLGSFGRRSTRFRHDSKNPLPFDVVIVDEVSMVSLPLMARLCEALRPETRLILVGDPDQLESVELGAVLGDLVRASGVDSGVPGPLGMCAVRLDRVHRFADDSPIARLADLVRLGDAEGARRFVEEVDDGVVRFVASDDPSTGSATEAIIESLAPFLTDLRKAAESGDAANALEVVGRFRLLCAHRRGTHGVAEWNRVATSLMRGGRASHDPWFVGRLVMITRNDARLGLANGDSGVVVVTDAGPKVAFRRAGEVLLVDPVQLDEVETAFAMTIHKSQGSEYPTVLMILPPEGSLLVGRELVYTGITRAREKLILVGSPAVVEEAVSTSSHRMTGLRDRID